MRHGYICRRKPIKNIILDKDNIIKELEAGDSYRYLDTCEWNTIKKSFFFLYAAFLQDIALHNMILNSISIFVATPGPRFARHAR